MSRRQLNSFVFFVVLAVLVLIVANASSAHTTEELVDWRFEWAVRVQEAGGLSPALLDELDDLKDRHVCEWPEASCTAVIAHPRVQVQVSSGVEQWRSLVAAHFPASQVDAALQVMSCESRGNPNAMHPGSRAAGLFQAMPQWYTGSGWFEPSAFGPFDPFDPAENVRFAAWLFNDSGWSPWVCRP